MLGLMNTYTCLHRSIVSLKQVNSFQHMLQQAVKRASEEVLSDGSLCSEPVSADYFASDSTACLAEQAIKMNEDMCT